MAAIIDRLAEQYSLVKGQDIGTSQIVVHPFVDLEATSKELEDVRWHRLLSTHHS